jgi:hypothetical protein
MEPGRPRRGGHWGHWGTTAYYCRVAQPLLSNRCCPTAVPKVLPYVLPNVLPNRLCNTATAQPRHNRGRSQRLQRWAHACAQLAACARALNPLSLRITLSISQVTLQRDLLKPNRVRCGDWEYLPLVQEQRDYAATDAFASLAVYVALMAKPLKEVAVAVAAAVPPVPAGVGEKAAEGGGAAVGAARVGRQGEAVEGAGRGRSDGEHSEVGGAEQSGVQRVGLASQGTNQPSA